MFVAQVTYNFKFCINLQWLTKSKIQMFKTTARITEEGSKEKLIINKKLWKTCEKNQVPYENRLWILHEPISVHKSKF